jgi:plasmid stabilization system protein ParE
MTFRVIYRDEAKQDLREILLYLGQSMPALRTFNEKLINRRYIPKYSFAFP